RVVSHRSCEHRHGRYRFQTPAASVDEVDLHGIEAPRGKLISVLLIVPHASQSVLRLGLRARVAVGTGEQTEPMELIGEPPQTVRPLPAIDDDVSVTIARSRCPARVQPNDAIPRSRQPGAVQSVSNFKDCALVVLTTQAEVRVPPHV